MVRLMMRADRIVALDARSPGDDSRTQLVALLESGDRTAETHRALPRPADWCRSTEALLRRRWPGTGLDTGAMPPYLARTLMPRQTRGR